MLFYIVSDSLMFNDISGYSCGDSFNEPSNLFIKKGRGEIGVGEEKKFSLYF